MRLPKPEDIALTYDEFRKPMLKAHTSLAQAKKAAKNKPLLTIYVIEDGQFVLMETDV